MMNDVATAETPNTLLEPAGAGLGETKDIPQPTSVLLSL